MATRAAADVARAGAPEPRARTSGAGLDGGSGLTKYMLDRASLERWARPLSAQFAFARATQAPRECPTLLQTLLIRITLNVFLL
eukprot:232611-Pyramimonas_sp.AAC.1